MVWDLATHITTEYVLRTLALFGLGESDPTIDTSLQNKHDINDAAHKVLVSWRRKQDNKKVVYSNLCDALRHKKVDVSLHIKQALKPHWQKETKKHVMLKFVHCL